MAFEVFKPLSESILSHLAGWATISDSIIGSLKGPILAALTLKLMWQGLNAIRGAGGRLVMVDAVLSNLRVVLVWWAALTAGSYTENVQGFLLALRNDLTGLFVPTTIDGYTAIDSMMTKATDALAAIFLWSSDHFALIPTPDMSGLVGIVTGFAMVTFMAIFGLVSCVNLLFVDLSIAFLIAIGPLFVACFAFQSTARFFDAWLGTVLKFIFMGVLVSSIAGMAIGIMSGYANKLADVDTMDMLTLTFSSMGASGVLILFAVFAPQLAASIANGIAVNAMSLSRAAGPIGAVAATAAAAAGASLKSAGGAAVNAASFGAGMAAASAPAQAVMSAFSTVSSGMGVLGGSASAAYAAGRGGSISAGGSNTAAASNRPLGSPAASRSLPPVSASQSRAAEGMRLSA